MIKPRGLTQTQAGKALGIRQPHVSLLMRNRAGSFSVGRLIVRPKGNKHGDLSVTLG
jgi:predicted XRE-type DNA-binding protein